MSDGVPIDGVVRHYLFDPCRVCHEHALLPVAGQRGIEVRTTQPIFCFTSGIILALFAVELALLIFLGPVRSRGLIGPGFYVAHLILFFLGTPALANSLVLRPALGFFAKWYVAGALCTILAFFLVLLQYSVSEALYGIDGDNGPYSQVGTHGSADFSADALGTA